MPPRETDCGEFAPELVKRREADRPPSAPAMNATDTLQVEPFARLAVHVFPVIEKSAELVPDSARPLEVTPVPEVLLKVTFWFALDAP